MKVHKDFNLIKHNNLRLNSIAKEFFIPENYEELTAVVTALHDRKTGFHILSGGSNVLLKPVIKTPIICLADLDNTLLYDKESNTVVAGCSIKIQTLIN